jgi:hypothetical protein
MKIIKFNEKYEDLQKIDEGINNSINEDWKWRFGNLIYEELTSSIESWIDENDFQKIYNGIEMWKYFRDKHIDESDNIFSKEQIKDLDFLTTKSSEMLLEKYIYNKSEKLFLEKFIQKINK